jgi:hypothetical protein
MHKAIAILCVVLVSGAGAVAQPPFEPQAPFQQPAPGEQQGQAPAELMSPEQLENLVAPVALYPDSLLGQVLAASTYPLEIVEAQQWMGQHRELRGGQLTEAARQQNWDASVQALVAFPDAMALLTRDIQWTTDLGNAFLAQQADVMNAIQILRERAQQNGRLQSTPQETVTAQPVEGGPPVIQIQPADPQVVYVPAYNPEYVWGPPACGAYPPLWYPSYGFGFGAATFLGGLFSGFVGFGGWGWGLNWVGHGLFLNNLFFSHFGFAGFHGGYGGWSAWSHNPSHRMGVAYSNRAVASRFGSSRYSGSARVGGGSYGGARSYAGNAARGYNGGGRSYSGAGQARSYSSGARSYSGSGQARSFNGGARSYSGAGQARSFNGGARSYSGAGQTRSFNGGARSYSSPGYGASRSFSANRGSPAQSSRNFSGPQSNRFSAPRSSGQAPSQHYSAPHSSGGHYSAPRSSGGHSSHSSGHSGGGSHKR